MTRKIIRILVLVAGPLIGWVHVAQTINGFLAGLACSLAILAAEVVIERIPLDNLVASILGGVLGLISAQLLDYAIYLLDNPLFYYRVHKYEILTNALLSYLGMVVAVRKKAELDLLDRNIIVPSAKKKPQDVILLDTSVIIDGRIIDIFMTQFMSGKLVVPRFVLNELHALSDSADNIKRQRGRRGLDILARLREIPKNSVTIYEKDYPNLNGADSKLVELSKELRARILTTDFNLNKVATLQGVQVLNINDLANALKTVVVPGETLTIFVMKDGKEKEQGIAYLDDGTMVVVEEGKRWVGKRAEVIVTSVLQTSAGRMIFSKIREDESV